LLRLLSKISRIISNLFGIPISRLLVIIIFFFRYIFLGWNNANDYLSRLSKPYIIPILKLYGAKIGKNCDIESGIRFHNCRNYKNLSVGNNCHIGKDCFFDLRDCIILGSNVVVSMRCSFITHIDLTQSILSKNYPAKREGITLCSDVYIGANSTVLLGVTIGKQSFVGANSLVIKDVDNNILVTGIPAKKIKSIGI